MICFKQRRPSKLTGYFCVLALVGFLFSTAGNKAMAQFGGGFGNQVGGVAIDAQGAMTDLRQQVRQEVANKRDQLAREVPPGMREGVELRKISLQALQEAISQARLAGDSKTLPPEMRYLGGIQRIQYIFVYPEKKDIVLAGPGEAWRIDELGQVVGATTGRPVILLQDFLVALRAAFAPEVGPITCSIDPTREGIRNLRTLMASFGRLNGPAQVQQVVARKQDIEESLGPQTVTVSGVDPTSRFAWTLVVADYRMKCLGMGLEPAPIAGMPSYLEMLKSHSKDFMPRWWMETDYETLLTDAEGLAWELRGQGVKVLAEDELVSDDGQRKRTGRVNKVARKWAETMTEKYDELSVVDPIFGQLRNCMDMAVVGALLKSENLPHKAGLNLDYLLDAESLATPAGTVPQSTPSIVSFLKRPRSLVITASGGVLINPYQVIEHPEMSDQLASEWSSAITKRRQDVVPGNWCWD